MGVGWIHRNNHRFLYSRRCRIVSWVPYRRCVLPFNVYMVKKFSTKDSGKRVTFATGMNRDVQDTKPRYDLIWTPLLKRWAELMTRGAVKYGERNWEKAKTQEELERFRASAFRHFMQWFDGEDDEDHAAAIMFNIAGVEYTKERIK